MGMSNPLGWNESGLSTETFLYPLRPRCAYSTTSYSTMFKSESKGEANRGGVLYSRRNAQLRSSAQMPTSLAMTPCLTSFDEDFVGWNDS